MAAKRFKKALTIDTTTVKPVQQGLTALVQIALDNPPVEHTIKQKLQFAVDSLEWSMAYQDFKSVSETVKLINQLVKELP